MRTKSHERFMRCLEADIMWWRDNARTFPDTEMKNIALEIAIALENILDNLRRRGRPTAGAA